VGFVAEEGGHAPDRLHAEVQRIAGEGGTPWPSRATARCSASSTSRHRQGGISARFEQLRAMGIRT